MKYLKAQFTQKYIFLDVWGCDVLKKYAKLIIAAHTMFCSIKAKFDSGANISF